VFFTFAYFSNIAIINNFNIGGNMCTLATKAMIAAKAAAAEEAANTVEEPVEEDPFCGMLVGHFPHTLERQNGEEYECPGYEEEHPQINGH
jgi:hypothetical protein